MTKLVVAAIPAGTVSLDPQAQGIRTLFADEWPEGLWIPATRLEDWEVVVFGRGDQGSTDVGTAVIASGAIPGVCVPVPIGVSQFVDGGLQSPTNAAVLAGEDLDLVIVCAALAGSPTVPGRAIQMAPRRSIHRQLHKETERLAASGTRVLLIEPIAADVDVQGWSVMDVGRMRSVALTATSTVAAHLEHPDNAEAVALLGP